MAETFEVLDILAKEFIRKISPRLDVLSPELKWHMSRAIEENLKRIISEDLTFKGMKVKLENLFAIFTSIVGTLENVAKESGISLKTQLPLVIPSILKRLDSGTTAFNSTRFETLIRELFAKVRIFEEILRTQKINMQQFSISVPKIAEMIDETPLEGFREAIQPALLQAEQGRVGLLKEVLTKPDQFPLYRFLNPTNSDSLEEVVVKSPQLALKAPREAKLNSRQPPGATYYSSHYGKVLRNPALPPVLTKYRLANNAPEGLEELQEAEHNEYTMGVHASLNMDTRVTEFSDQITSGNVARFTAMLNRGINPNTLTFSPLALICSGRVPATKRPQFISILCSPTESEAPHVRIPNTTSEEITTSEHSFLDNLFNRIFYRFNFNGTPICASCVQLLNEEEGIAAIRQLTTLPIHQEGNPFSTAVQQIQAKFEQDIQATKARLDAVIESVPGFKGEVEARRFLQGQRTLDAGDTNITVPAGTEVWLRERQQGVDTWKKAVIVRKYNQQRSWLISLPEQGNTHEAAEDSRLVMAGTRVFVRVEGVWQEMNVAGQVNEEGMCPVRPPGPPGTTQPILVPYKELKVLNLDFLTRNKQYSESRQRMAKLSETIKHTQGFLRGVNINDAAQNGETALTKACNKNYTNLVSVLAELGADINLQTGATSTTPLMEVVKKGNVELVTLFCSNPAINIGLRDSTDHTALFYALNTNKSRGVTEEHLFAIVQLLIGAGADPHERYGDVQVNALNIAVSIREMPCIQYLLDDIHLNLNEPNGEGSTPLMYAVFQKRQDVIQLLIERGANINALDRNQENALFFALAGRKYRDQGTVLQIIQYLVKKGIDYRQQNTNGFTIYTWAQANLRGREDKPILAYLGKLFGCVGGICRTIGIEGFGPNANTRRRAAVAASPQALTAVAPTGGSRRKRRTKGRRRRQSRR